ncbi:MAG: MFS transporter [Candidatus Falkowbacteria bacterium]
MKKLSPYKTAKENKRKEAGLKIMYFLGFILSLATALPAYVESSYLGQFVKTGQVSLFFLGANIIAFFAIIFFPRVIKKLTNYTTSLIILVLTLIASATLGLATNAWQAFASFAALWTGFCLLLINMDIFVEGFSAEKSTGKTRTIYFTAMNLAWVLSPAISGLIIKNWGYRPIYILSALILIPFIVIFHNKSKNLEDHFEYQKSEFKKTLKNIWQNKNLRGIVFMAFILQLFYATAVVYVPIYLTQDLGISWSSLGIIFSIMLLPFIIFEIPAGIMADKIGEKKLMAVGLTILIISLVLFSVTLSDNLIIWTLILFFSRTGAALVEAMREAYFFKIVTVKHVDLINFFRSTQPLAYIFGSLLSLSLLTYLPISHFFLIIAILFLSGYYFIKILKDTN